MFSYEKRRFAFVAKSSNEKTGDIAQTYTDSASCPASCPFHDPLPGFKMSACYAQAGFHTRMAWNRAALTFDELAEKIKKFTKPGDLIRHNVAGDMANARGELDLFLVAKLANAFLNRKAYTYTHCPINRDSAAAINNVRECTGFLINASCETVAEVLNAHAHSVPAVLAVKSRAELPADTDTEKYVLCPAQSGYKTCKTCRLCQKERLNKAGRRVVICFEAHGANARQAGMVLDSKNKVIPIHTH